MGHTEVGGERVAGGHRILEWVVRDKHACAMMLHMCVCMICAMQCHNASVDDEHQTWVIQVGSFLLV